MRNTARHVPHSHISGGQTRESAPTFHSHYNLLPITYYLSPITYHLKTAFGYLFSFSSRLYSFFVIRMNEPCWGAVTPLMSCGSWKPRRCSSALQMR